MTTKSDIVKVGVFGWGMRLSGLISRLLEASEGKIEVGALYDPDPLAIESARTKLGTNVTVCESEEALSACPELEWILIGSLNNQHSRHAVGALNAGKHVFCEKPLATSLEDCLAVRNAIHKSGRTFSFGLVLRYSPHYQKVKDLVASGSIGKIVSFEFNETLHFNHGGYIFGNWRRNRSVAGTHLLEKCCHDLDLANWITGSLPVKAASFGGTDFFVPENAPHASRIGLNKDGQPAYSVWKDPHGISPFSEGADIADNQVAILQYASGARATFHTNCNSGIPERRFYICGTEGGLRADLHSGIIEFQRIGHDSKIERVSDGTMDLHGGGDKRLATALAATILEGKAPLATVEDGMKACVTAFGIDEAMDTGKVIDLKPMWNRCGIELRSPAVPKPLASQ